LASLFLATRTDPPRARARAQVLHLGNRETRVVGNHHDARAFEDLAEFLDHFLFLGSIHSFTPVPRLRMSLLPRTDNTQGFWQTKISSRMASRRRELFGLRLRPVRAEGAGRAPARPGGQALALLNEKQNEKGAAVGALHLPISREAQLPVALDTSTETPGPMVELIETFSM
jgi:hypothetical protein